MDEELKSLLEKNLQVSEASLHLLQKMHRAVVWGRIFTTIKWAIIIGLIIFGLFKLQPYIVYWTQVLTTISTDLQKVNSFFPK